MNGKSFILSSSGLKNIVEDQNEFTFIFGEIEVKMNNTFAEFISPLVSHLHHSDPTINSIHFSYPSKSYFSSIEETLTKENIKILQLISRGTKLELFQYLSNYNHFKQYNELENLINNISSNFHMIDQKELKKLSNPILYKIISNETFKRRFTT